MQLLQLPVNDKESVPIQRDEQGNNVTSPVVFKCGVLVDVIDEKNWQKRNKSRKNSSA